MHKRFRGLDTLADKLFRRCGGPSVSFSRLVSLSFFPSLFLLLFASLILPSARNGQPAWFRREIYIANLFIHLLRAFVYSCPADRPNNGYETRRGTALRPMVTVTFDSIDPFIAISSCRGRY